MPRTIAMIYERHVILELMARAEIVFQRHRERGGLPARGLG